MALTIAAFDPYHYLIFVTAGRPGRPAIMSRPGRSAARAPRHRGHVQTTEKYHVFRPISALGEAATAWSPAAR